MIDHVLQQLVAKPNIGSNTTDGQPYQPLPYFMQQEIKSQKPGNVAKEFRLVYTRMLAHPSTVLEIGANIGFYSFNLMHDLKCRCKAIEIDPDNIRVMKYINRMAKDALGLPGIQISNKIDFNNKFDYLLMMNVHHWLVKEHGLDKTLQIMKRLYRNCDAMFFQTAHKESRATFKVESLSNEKQVREYLQLIGWDKINLIGNTQTVEYPRYLYHCIK